MFKSNLGEERAAAPALRPAEAASGEWKSVDSDKLLIVIASGFSGACTYGGQFTVIIIVYAAGGGRPGQRAREANRGQRASVRAHSSATHVRRTRDLAAAAAASS